MSTRRGRGAAERIRAIDALIRTKKAERERDDALGRLDRVRDERDEATTLSVQVVRERDEAVSREFNLRNAIRNHPAMRGTVGLYQSSDEEFVDAVTGRIARMADEADERDEWRERAEKAEARITVTRADIENAIQSCRIVQPYADNVMYVEVDEVHERLFGVADHDPVEAKAEELWRAVNGTLNDWETEDSGIREEFRLIAAHVLWSDR